MDLVSQTALQLTLALFSGTIIMGSIILFSLMRSSKPIKDIESSLPLFLSSSSLSLPSTTSTSPSSSLSSSLSSPSWPSRKSSKAVREILLAPKSYSPQKVADMLREKRQRVCPEFSSPRKFALVNLHARNVFFEDRLSSHLPPHPSSSSSSSCASSIPLSPSSSFLAAMA